MRREHYSEGTRPRTRRKTVNSIRRDRIARFITIPLFLIIMLFLMVPVLLVILELSSRLVMESKLLGGLSLVAGFGLGFLLFIHVVSFRKEDQEFMRSFVIVFLVFFLIITIGKLVSDNTLHFNQVLERYKNSFKTYIKMFEEGASKASYTTSEASFHSTFDSVAWDMADDDTRTGLSVPISL